MDESGKDTPVPQAPVNTRGEGSNRVLPDNQPADPTRRKFIMNVGKGLLGLGTLATLGRVASENFSSEMMGQPQEEGIFKATLHSVQDQEREFSPIIRTNPKVDMHNEVSPEDYKKLGLDLASELQGEKVYGGAYVGIHGGSERNEEGKTLGPTDEKGRPLGKWFKVQVAGEDGQKRTFYIAENFVTYGERVDEPHVSSQ